MNKKQIVDKLKSYGIPAKELERYNEEHRFYHNLDHIISMILSAMKQNILTDNLFLAIVFHDIIYDPKARDNEEKSAQLFLSYVRNFEVSDAILETKLHRPTTTLGKQLCTLDLEILNSDFATFMDFEGKIFKEYQWVDFSIYKEKRVKILSKLGVNKGWIQYVKHRKPNIALYAGSFNPFHVGHYNILTKAEQIFDKVIIARGNNPEKHDYKVDLPKEIQYIQVIEYNNLLTKLISELEYDVTLIRGLRSANDINHELIQYRFLQDFNPEIKVVSIICDRQFEHISSSAIRQLEKFNAENKYIL